MAQSSPLNSNLALMPSFIVSKTNQKRGEFLYHFPPPFFKKNKTNKKTNLS